MSWLAFLGLGAWVYVCFTYGFGVVGSSVQCIVVGFYLQFSNDSMEMGPGLRESRGSLFVDAT